MVLCSAPPIYNGTGSHRFIFSGSANLFLFFGSAYRMKYHEESTKVSIVSVSRSAKPPHMGQRVFTHRRARARGDLPSLAGLKSLSGGRDTGKSFSDTG